jgi:hypothetical protein
MVDLGDLGPQAPGLVCCTSEAVAVNDLGQFVGYSACPDAALCGVVWKP